MQGNVQGLEFNIFKLLNADFLILNVHSRYKATRLSKSHH
jgi:hypothetical protein